MKRFTLSPFTVVIEGKEIGVTLTPLHEIEFTCNEKSLRIWMGLWKPDFKAEANLMWPIFRHCSAPWCMGIGDEEPKNLVGPTFHDLHMALLDLIKDIPTQEEHCGPRFVLKEDGHFVQTCPYISSRWIQG